MNASTDLCVIPAAPAPVGVTSNFDTPISMAPALIGVLALTLAWGIIFTSARFFVNIRKLDWADCEWYPGSIVNLLHLIHHLGIDFNLIALLLSISILGIQITR